MFIFKLLFLCSCTIVITECCNSIHKNNRDHELINVSGIHIQPQQSDKEILDQLTPKTDFSGSGNSEGSEGGDIKSSLAMEIQSYTEAENDLTALIFVDELDTEKSKASSEEVVTVCSQESSKNVESFLSNCNQFDDEEFGESNHPSGDSSGFSMISIKIVKLSNHEDRLNFFKL